MPPFTYYTFIVQFLAKIFNSIKSKKNHKNKHKNFANGLTKNINRAIFNI
jgi:hypothetical protein